MSLNVYLSCDCGRECCMRTLYQSNITHNLNTMAKHAGVYRAIWRPEEIGIDKAEQLIQPLDDCIRALQGRPSFFKRFNAENGWGLYEHFVTFVEKYLDACKKFPNAKVSVSR